MKQIFAIGALALVLIGCSASAPAGVSPAAGTGQPAAETSAAAAPTTAPDRTTVVGQIISTRTNQPITNTSVRLAQVYRQPGSDAEGAFVLDEARSPGSRTDGSGRFVIANIGVEEYVLMISTDMGQHMIVTEGPGIDKAKIWKTEAGKVIDLGEVRVDFP
jgi:hypothetical protein